MERSIFIQEFTVKKYQVGQGGKMGREDRITQIYHKLGQHWELSSVMVARVCGLVPGQHVRSILFEMMERGMIGGYRTTRTNKMEVYYWYRLDRSERYQRRMFEDEIPV